MMFHTQTNIALATTDWPSLHALSLTFLASMGNIVFLCSPLLCPFLFSPLLPSLPLSSPLLLPSSPPLFLPLYFLSYLLPFFFFLCFPLFLSSVMSTLKIYSHSCWLFKKCGIPFPAPTLCSNFMSINEWSCVLA